MASNPLFVIPDFFFCIFQTNFAMATLGYFPISFKPKLAMAEFFLKLQKKTWYSVLGSDVMPLSLKNLLLNWFHALIQRYDFWKYL